MRRAGAGVGTAEVDRGPPAEENLPADVCDLRAVSGARGLAHHLGAPALPPPGGGRHPELVLEARPQSSQSVAPHTPRHLLAPLAPLPAVLHLPDVHLELDDLPAGLLGRQPGDKHRVLAVHDHLDAGGRAGN